MENASKALIIAGAILVSILIISLGIMVYNNAKSTVGDANLDSETIQTYNNKFTMYAGNGVQAAKVNSLIEAVNANNVTSDNLITISYTGTAAAIGTTTQSTNNTFDFSVSSTQTYTVTYTLGSTGMVSTITIGN